MIVEDNTCQGAGHTGHQHIASGTAMRKGSDTQALKEILEGGITLHMGLVVQQILAEGL